MPLLNKTLMCGGLVVLAPGSPLQCLIAILIMFGHLLLVLKLAPYNKWTEDWSQLFTSMTLMFITLGAFTGMMYHDDQTQIDRIGTILVVLSISCLFVNILITVCFDCGGWQSLRRGRQREQEEEESSSGGKKTQVLPIASSMTSEERNELKSWSVKEGNKKQVPSHVPKVVISDKLPMVGNMPGDGWA
jgi:putative effector of murein hydrolase LrgA (UPF0299 family)